MLQINIGTHRIDGMKVITSPQWDGEIFQLSRNAFLKNKDFASFSRPGVYVIYADHFDKNLHGHKIYIGQGDEVRSRLEAHTSKKDFWNRVLFFTSSWMNIAYAFNIEAEFIQAIKLASRYALDNGVSGQKKQMSAEDLARCETFVKTSKTITHLANLDIFAANTDGLFLSSKKFMGQATLRIAKLHPPTVIVVAGSILRFLSSTTPAQVTHLVTSGDIIPIDSGEHRFLRDVEVELETAIQPKMLGISASWFENDCGTDIAAMISALNGSRIFSSD